MLNIFALCSSLISITIPNSVTKIESYSFYGCSSLISFTIPNSVTSIGESAFDGCSGLFSFTLPNSVTSIGVCAFRNCSGMTSITIPNSVTAIGYDAFAGCTGLTSITIPEGVTSIESETFYGCSGLTSITIPNGVTSIGFRAFKKCRGLSSISIPSSVKTIGGDAFDGCYSLSSVNISDLSAWCNIKYGSSESNNLFPSNHHLYLNGIEIERLVIPSDITSLGDYIFYGCSYLTSIIIPNSVISIGESAFAGCSKVETLKLPDNLQIIKKATFKGCSSLKTVTIPAVVEVIYQEAFADCYTLENVKATPGTPPFLYDNSFSNFSIPLEVPKGCKEEYQTAQGWKNFTNIIESDKGYYKLVYLVDNEEYKTYKTEEGTTITPEPAPTKEGYTFSGWSEIPETMPAHNVTVTGTFSINKYKLTYTIDGEEYKSYEVEYGAAITPETAPTKVGYTFSGWTEIPETMPAHDVTVTGTFTKTSFGKCATPTMAIKDGELIFECETEGVEYHYSITAADVKDNTGNKIKLAMTYKISVYASKEGYEDSDTITQEIKLFSGMRGDVNEDGVIDVADVVGVVNIILEKGDADASRTREKLKENGFIF